MGTNTLNIIEHIWSDTLVLREGGDRPPLADILSSLIAAPMICFTIKTGCPASRAFVSYAGDEVLPGASLADVLFEEFGIEVSDQTVVLVEPPRKTNTPRISSDDLGQALGQILVELAGLNQDENRMIKQAAQSYPLQQSNQPTNRRAMVSLVQ